MSDDARTDDAQKDEAQKDEALPGGFVRQEGRPVEGPADLDLTVDVGRVEVYLDDPANDPANDPADDPVDPSASPSGDTASGADANPSDTPRTTVQEVRVEVRHDPAATGGWAQRLGEVASWLGTVGAAPDEGPQVDTSGIDAVRAAEISWTEAGPLRLTVRSSTDLPLRMVPLRVTVWAPAGTRVAARTGAGDVSVHGRAGHAVLRTGAGTARTGDVDGDADVTTGSGDVTMGAVSGRARIRTGSGAVSVAAVRGVTDVKAGSGDVTLGEVAADLGVRTGTGAVQVADARRGLVELSSGSGGLRIGVHPGVVAELDLSAGSGRAHSELEVRRSAPPREPALRLRGRTASGDVLVTRATAATATTSP